ncbi:MAG: NAD(P)/FAD-dependent oxidoreductase [Candidatus Babeliales bacterium]
MRYIRALLKGIFCIFAILGFVTAVQLIRRTVRTQMTPSAELSVSSQKVHPVVIIGSGSAGLAAAKTILEEDIPVVVLEGKQAGGALNIFTPVANWPGLSTTSGTLILSDLRAEVAAHKEVRFIARSVDSFDFSGPIHILHLDNGETIQAQTVVIAMGTRLRWLTVPGAQEYASFISYDQKPDSAQKSGTCVVIGGGVDALRKAVFRLNAGARVVLVVRGNRLGEGIVLKWFSLYGGKDRAKLLDDYSAQGKLTILFNSEVAEFIGDGSKLTGVRLSTGDIISADCVAVGIGRVPNTELFKIQLDLDADGYIMLKNHSQQTSRPGVFAAGDITSALYAEGAIAAGDGMKAAKDVMRYLVN